MSAIQSTPTPPPPGRSKTGSHVAIAAIAAFALLLLFVIFYRGDRPGEEAIERDRTAMEEQRRTDGDEGARAEAEESTHEIPELEEQPTGLRADPRTQSPENARGQEPSAANLRNRNPKTDLVRPGLGLGAKPAEVKLSRAGAGAGAPTRTIGEEEIRRVVGANERDVKTCFENLTRTQKIEVKLKVIPSGAVADASVKNPLPTEETDCIENKARSWKFKAPGGEETQDITVPFVVISSATG